MPEPPRWLIQNNRLKEAETVVRRMAKVNDKKLPANLDKILQEIRVGLYTAISIHLTYRVWKQLVLVCLMFITDTYRWKSLNYQILKEKRKILVIFIRRQLLNGEHWQ